MARQISTQTGFTDWKQTNAREVDKIMAIVAPELHSFIEEHAALSQLMDRVREGYNTEIYREALRADRPRIGTPFPV